MFPSSLLLIRGRSGQAAGQGPRAVPLLPASRDGAVLPAPWERRKCHPAPTQRARWYLAAGAVKSYTRKNIFSCFWAESPGGYGAGPIPTSPCSPAPKNHVRPSRPRPEEAQSETRPPCKGEPPGVPWEGGGDAVCTAGDVPNAASQSLPSKHNGFGGGDSHNQTLCSPVGPPPAKQPATQDSYRWPWLGLGHGGVWGAAGDSMAP